MRCWIGIESEHNENFGNKTLFVEGSHINLYTIVDILQTHQITSVYLGAGEIDLYSFVGDINLLNDYYVILETNKIHKVTKQLNHYVNKLIVRTDELDLDTLENVDFKYRLKNEVGIASASVFIKTDISNVKDGRYTDDVVVFDETV